MSDDDLLKCLRHRVPDPRRGYKSDATVLLNPHGEPAAARIEQLAAINEELEAKLAECEARLEKAVESLTVIDALDPEAFVNGCSQSALIGLVSRMGAIARTTLEEIKGKDT